jgi:hypothetical protein
MRAVAQIEQPAYRVLGHAKLFGLSFDHPRARIADALVMVIAIVYPSAG